MIRSSKAVILSVFAWNDAEPTVYLRFSAAGGGRRSVPRRSGAAGAGTGHRPRQAATGIAAPLKPLPMPAIAIGRGGGDGDAQKVLYLLQVKNGDVVQIDSGS